MYKPSQRPGDCIHPVPPARDGCRTSRSTPWLPQKNLLPQQSAPRSQISEAFMWSKHPRPGKMIRLYSSVMHGPCVQNYSGWPPLLSATNYKRINNQIHAIFSLHRRSFDPSSPPPKNPNRPSLLPAGSGKRRTKESYFERHRQYSRINNRSSHNKQKPKDVLRSISLPLCCQTVKTLTFMTPCTNRHLPRESNNQPPIHPHIGSAWRTLQPDRSLLSRKL